MNTVINLAAGITNNAPTIVNTLAFVSYMDNPIIKRTAANTNITTATSRLNDFIKLM